MKTRFGPAWTKTLGLAATLFALGSFAYWLEFKKRPADEESADNAAKIFPLGGQAIATIELKTPDGRPVTLACADLASGLCRPGDNSQWELTSPLRSRADAGNVNALVTTLDSMVGTPVIDLSSDPAEKRAQLLRDYGLGANILSTAESVKVTLKDGRVLVAHFGGKHPIGEGTFAVATRNGKLDDAKVYVANPGAIAGIRHPLTYYRDKRILPLAEADVKRLAYDRRASRQKISAVRGETGWEVSDSTSGGERVALPGDADALGALVSTATYLTAKEFAAEDKTSPEARKVLAGTRKIFTFRLGDGKTERTLEFHERAFRDGKKKATQLYVTVDGLDPLYDVDTGTVDRLDRNLDDLRQRKLVTTMDRFGAKAVSFAKRGEGAYTEKFANRDGKWVAESGAAVDQTRVQMLLDRFAQNGLVRAFVSPVPAGAEQGLEIRVGPADAPGRSAFVIWKDGTRLVARMLDSKRDEALLLDPTLLILLPLKKETLAEAPPVDAAKLAAPADGDHDHGHEH